MAGEKPLSNDDFRKLLMTPRPDMAPNIQAQAAAKKQKATRHPHPQKPTGAKPSGKGDAEAEAEAGYRDRAAERRMGLDSEWNGLASGMGMPQDISRLSYDESKYLGGDEEHTHLVKGLDYALLSKVRSERGAKEDQKALQGTKDGALQSKLQGPSFRTPLSRAIYDFLFGRQQVLVRVASSERFLPRRTAFVYTMAERDTAEVPTTLNRAKEDCPKPQPSLNGGVDLAVLERLAKIMAYTSLSREGKKKLKKKEVQDLVAMQPAATSVAPIDESGRRTSPEGPAPPVDDDEDIFGDAGRDYVVERRTANAEGPIEHPAKRAYFEDGEELGAEGVGPLSGPAPGVLPLEGAYPDTDAAFADVEARAAQEKRTARDREKRRLEMLAAQDADDGYAECYPSYFDAAGTIYDSEDEDAAGRKNDEGAQEGDARTAARRESAKQAMKEKSKLDTELNQIHKVFEEKGFKDHGAFGKQGVSKKEGEEAKEESSVQVFTKKRRI